MKYILLLQLGVIITFACKAQNIGINTTTPQATLDVNGTLRANTIAYSGTKIKHYTLSGIDFKPEFSTDTANIGVGGASITMSSSLPGKRLIAALHLPDGATITKMTPWIADASTVDNLEIIFYKKTLADNFFAENQGNVSSSGSTGVATAFPVSLFNSVVDNTTYTYYISAGLSNSSHVWSGTFYLSAVIIEYTLSGP